MTEQTQTPRGTRTAEVDPATGRLVLGWALVGLPLAYGLWQTLTKAASLFTG